MIVEEKHTETISILIKELKEECEAFIKLADKLEGEDLPEDQIDEILGEIMASVVHLNAHTEQVKEELYNSIDSNEAR